MREFIFRLNPIAASRPRVSKWGAYYTGPYKNFRVEAVDAIADTLGEEWVPLEGPLLVEVEVVVTRPKTTKLDYPKPDIDNYLKSVFDCLNGKLWVDDKQIVIIKADQSWNHPKEDGFFVVRVDKLEK